MTTRDGRALLRLPGPGRDGRAGRSLAVLRIAAARSAAGDGRRTGPPRCHRPARPGSGTGWSPPWPRPGACTSPRSRASSRARCAGTSGSRCIRSWSCSAWGSLRSRRDAPSCRRRALALLGAIVAGYHVALEWIPALDGGACDPTNPCTLVWFRTFGFISLPTLALTAFLLILTLLAFRPTRDGLDDRPGVAT